MAQKNKIPYQIFDSYCLRTPLFSLSDYKSLIEREGVLETDFRNLLQNKIFREALFLASPELVVQIQKWENQEILDKKKKESLELTILKYFTRITTRCTPFGLFASCSQGSFSDKTSIQLAAIEDYKRITRFDTTFLAELSLELIKKDEIRKQLLFFPNSSLYRVGGHYRYVEYVIQNKKRAYSIEGIKFSTYLKDVLEAAKEGNTIAALAKVLVSDDIELIEAKGFIEELIEHQILVSELEVTVTGSDYFSNLIKKVSEISENEELKNKLMELSNHLNKIDDSFGNSASRYKKIEELSKQVTPKKGVKYLFQTDTFSKTTQNKLNRKHKSNLYKALRIFNKMTLRSTSGRLEDFKRAYTKRYESEWLPLSLVLDVETGIGYGKKEENNTPFLDKIVNTPKKKRYKHIVWRDVDSILQEKLFEALAKRKTTIRLTDQDFESIEERWDDLPDTFSSIIEVFKSSGEEKLFIKGTGGSSAINLLGRFGHGSEGLSQHINNIAETEKNIEKDKVIAEIVHLPEARTGNILQRPNFRDYEIPYLGKSNVAKEREIPLSDILVTVKNDEIKLFSKKLNKEVIPRLGNAHNYSNSTLPIYHFLCELQTQNKRASIGFSWNATFLNLPFLPRVVYKDIIFSKTRWNLETDKLGEILKSKDFFKQMVNWKKELQLPNYVELVEGDNRLLIYLENKTAVQMLYNAVKRKKNFVLEEFLFVDDELVKREGTSFCNQFVVSFYNNKTN
ncbi:lantibiotic dehydratase family protein [Tenacibaculum sp. ZH5_bin.1]|uniref:lantibiotic dehydratase family protein n=1 Tax=Tenacibaculum TaxID=104267 RepID=UPI0014311273|nr:lantibiotic dehydratase family protein [Tenacibaculum mesophilum]KAF9659143.1 lantibiotic dehydratase family protein [Tenacibaculum mesophilum]